MTGNELRRLVDVLESQLSALHMALSAPAMLATLTGKTDRSATATFALCSQCLTTLQELKAALVNTEDAINIRSKKGAKK